MSLVPALETEVGRQSSKKEASLVYRMSPGKPGLDREILS